MTTVGVEGLIQHTGTWSLKFIVGYYYHYVSDDWLTEQRNCIRGGRQRVVDDDLVDAESQ